MVSSVKDKGVTQPAIVRPREDGGYEIVSGHRRQKASELAGYADMPCIIRNLTDEQAITQMVEDNTNQRENILPSELWWSQMRSFSPWQLPAFPLYLVEQAVALRIGAYVLHEDAAPDLVRAFQVFPEQHGPAADEHHAACL